MDRRLRRITVVAAGFALALGAGVPGAAAHGSNDRGSWRDGTPTQKSWHGSRHGTWDVGKTLADGLFAPLLGLAVADRGVVVSQSFAGTLTRIGKDGTTQDIFSEAPNGIAGLDVGRRGAIVYTVGPNAPTDPPIGQVKVLKRNGTTKVLADTLAYEQANNPDQVNSYGFQGLSAECAAQVPAEIGGDPYNGMVDSHAYAVALTGHGSFYVADAGGNTILRVTRGGSIRTVAVLPPQPLTVTAEMAAGLGLPDCVKDHAYNFEPVPTDVEIGEDGALYVTTLPGGPEGPELGARGSVYRVNPWSGSVKLVATGFLGAVDLAVDDNGQIYVAEMFGNQVSKVVRGEPRKIADVPTPGAIEFARGKLYVTSSGDFATPTAKVITLTR